MDVLTLLRSAETSGLTVTVEGDSLRVRGPISATPIVREIQNNKAAVIGALKAETYRLNDETATLVEWFQEEGQRLIPDGPFHVTKWITVTNPARFREHLLFIISLGPASVNWRHGHLKDNLRLLKEKLLPAQDQQPEETR
jgi:hypothetical protein